MSIKSQYHAKMKATQRRTRHRIYLSERPHRRQPTRLPCPWDSPGKNTGVDCHFFLQCMKMKSESEIAQSCPTPSNPMDCSLPGSSVHRIFQARVLEWGAIAFSVFHRGCINLHSHQQWKSVPSSPAFIVCRLFDDGHFWLVWGDSSL